MRQIGRLSRPTKLKEAQECSCLQIVIKEAMRLYFGIGLHISRVVPKGGLTLGGRFFPAGVGPLLAPHLTLPYNSSGDVEWESDQSIYEKSILQSGMRVTLCMFFLRSPFPLVRIIS